MKIYNINSEKIFKYGSQYVIIFKAIYSTLLTVLFIYLFFINFIIIYSHSLYCQFSYFVAADNMFSNISIFYILSSGVSRVTNLSPICQCVI